MSAMIAGVGAALPKTCIRNTDFVSMGIDDKWILSRTGVRERYHLQGDERLVDLAVQAAGAALEDCGLQADMLDMVIVATSTPDRISPGIAAELAFIIGADRAGAIDMNGACTGFLYALDYAMARIEHGASDRILVVGADAMSRLTSPDDHNTAFLFGDGAGAVIVEASETGICGSCTQYLSFGSDGRGAVHLHVSRTSGNLQMDGGEVYAAAVDSMVDEINNVLSGCGFDQEDFDYLICHQANARIVKAVARELQLPQEKAVSYVDRFGNTSAASIPIALWQAQQERKLEPGHRLIFAAFGAGFTWGAGIVNWKGCKHK